MSPVRNEVVATEGPKQKPATYSHAVSGWQAAETNSSRLEDSVETESNGLHLEQVQTDTHTSQVTAKSVLQREPERRPLLKLNGELEGRPVVIMIDSGATSNFIDSAVVERHDLPRVAIAARRVKLANGEAHVVRHAVANAALSIGEANSKENFFVFPLSSSNNVILGQPWLTRVNPMIDWQKRTVRTQSGEELSSQNESGSKEQANLHTHRSSKLNSIVNQDDEEILCTAIVTCEDEIATADAHASSECAAKATSVVRNDRELQMIRRFEDRFPTGPPTSLPPFRPGHDFSIETDPNAKPPCLPVRKMSPAENEELKKQLSALMNAGSIVPSRAPYGAPVTFARKKSGELRLCIDYRALNAITVRDRYALPNVAALLDQVGNSKVKSTLDLRSGYHQLRVIDEDVPKTTFRTRYGSFAFRVLPFGVTNGPGRFMGFLQEAFRDMLDQCVVIFIDDLLVYSPNEEQHEKDLTRVLQRLRELKLECKLSKCRLFRDTVSFLGYELRPGGVAVQQDKIEAIRDWPLPKCASDVRSFIGLTTFYREFVRNFSKICAPLSDLTKKGVKWEWTLAAQQAFDELKAQMQTTPVLAVPNPDWPFTVTTDSSDFAVGAVLAQTDPGTNKTRPVCFMSKKLSDAERRWPTHEQELFAIVRALTTWRHYLLGAQFKVYTDHRSLQYLFTQPNLSARQIRWIELFADFDIGNKIHYQEGKSNVVADALSRRHDMKPDSSEPRDVEARAKRDRMMKQLMLQNYELNSAISATEPSVIDAIRAAYDDDPVIGRDAPIAKKVRELNKLTRKDELWFKQDRIYVPDVSSIKTKLMHEAHDAQHAGHLGTEKTVKLLSRNYVWPRMHEDVKSYVSSCMSCQQNKSINQLQQGLLQPLPIPNECWQQCTMDLITQLPRTKKGNDAIVVVIDKLSKLTHVWPTTTTVGAVELARQFFHEVVRLHGFPTSIVSDRDPRFTSLFWGELWRMSGTKLAMSTAYHPQTDGQTERQNRTLEEMLRAFVSVQQNDWDEQLDAAELAINNSTQASSKETPFYLTYGRHVRTPLNLAVPSSTNQSAVDVVETLRDAHALAREKLIEAQQRQSEYANKHRQDVSFEVGDKVMLSTRNLKLKNRAEVGCETHWTLPNN